jgi:hypothetical protein
MNITDDEDDDDDDMADKDDDVSEELASRYPRTFLPMSNAQHTSRGNISFPLVAGQSDCQ